MAAKISKNNVIAGLFVVLAMVMAVGISVLVSGAQKRLASTTPYTIRFTLADGASGLKVDSPVTVGGQEVGRVTAISFNRAASGALQGVDVRVVVRSEIKLFEDAWAFLEKPLLGSMSAINISRVGGEPDPLKNGAIAPVLGPMGVLQGVIAPPSFLAQAGYGPDQVRQVKLMIAEASQAVEKVNRMADRVEAALDPNLKGLKAAIDDVNAITSEWRGKSPQWTATVDSVLVKADDAAGRLKPIADKVEATVADADDAMKRLTAAIEENRGPLKSAVASIDEAAQRFKTQTMDQVDATLKSARTGADEFRQAQTRLNETLREETPNIQRILANFRLASDQIKLVGIEVRRNPWRLLYSPKTKELESELFYDAARTYAEAVSDLRAASEALEATSATTDPSSREPVHQIKLRLEDAFKRYEDAEKVLLKRMTEK